MRPICTSYKLLYVVQSVPYPDARQGAGGAHMALTSQRGRPGPKGTLSDQTILDAAQNLLSRGGAGAVTIRGIAAQVGVAPNAVYTYFRDKAAVLRALVERLLGEVDVDGLTNPTRPWRHRLQSLA